MQSKTLAIIQKQLKIGTQSEWSEPILYCRNSSKIESLTIYPSELTLEKGSSYEIDYSYTPNVAFLEKPWFSIDNNDVLYLYNTNEIHMLLQP